MKNIYYWSPCLANVGTVKSTINSAIALSKYNNKNYKVFLINSCGEWDNYRNLCEENNITLVDLKFKYFKYLPKNGFIQSRFSYVILFLLSYFPLLKMLKKVQPHFLILHLVTSLPLFLMMTNKFKTQFILRISGYPKLNFLRKFFWKICSDRLYCITSPTKDLIKQIKNSGIFNNDKIEYLPDAILNIKNINLEKKDHIKSEILSKNFFIAAGRLTKQKNFIYLINEFNEFLKVEKKYDLLIFGEGEEKQKLKKKIKQYNIEDKVFLMGHTKSLNFAMTKAKAFILSSLWEEPGFVLIEAASNNLFIISSDCKNGPREFLLDGKAGLLFKNNKSGELLIKLKEIIKLDQNQKKNKILVAKKNIKNYTIFGHYLKIKKILN